MEGKGRGSWKRSAINQNTSTTTSTSSKYACISDDEAFDVLGALEEDDRLSQASQSTNYSELNFNEDSQDEENGDDEESQDEENDEEPNTENQTLTESRTLTELRTITPDENCQICRNNGDQSQDESQGEDSQDSDSSSSYCTCTVVRRIECNRLHHEKGRGKKDELSTAPVRYNLRSNRPCSSQTMKGYSTEKQSRKTVTEKSSNKTVTKTMKKVQKKSFFPDLSITRTFFPRISLFKREEEEEQTTVTTGPNIKTWQGIQTTTQTRHLGFFSDDEDMNRIPSRMSPPTAIPARKTPTPVPVQATVSKEESLFTRIWLWFLSIYALILSKAENFAQRCVCFWRLICDITIRKLRDMWKETIVCYHRLLVYFHALYSIPKAHIMWLYLYLVERKTTSRSTRARVSLRKQDLPWATKMKTKVVCDKMFTVLLFLLVLLFAICFDRFYMRKQRPQGPIIHPIDSGISNGYPMHVETDGSSIPAWYLYPTQQEIASMIPAQEPLKGVNPVILLLRNSGVVNKLNLVKLYRILSSFGYHVVIPVDVLKTSDVLKAWNWIKSQTDANAYVWGYGMNATTLTQNAELFCKKTLPPHGVVIAKEAESEAVEAYQTMEIWSCNCARAGKQYPQGSLKYNYVKCPIVFVEHYANDVYTQVVTCLETVNKRSVQE